MIDVFKSYKIPHIGLKKVIHYFDFELTEEFFKNFENSILHHSNISLNLTFDKRNEPYILDFDFVGEIIGDCDKCTSQIPIKIDANYRVYVNFGINENIEDTDELEVIFMKSDTPEIDISQLIYDFAHLSVPFYNVCSNPTKLEICDKEILNLLENQNIKKEDDNEIDPRWETLNKIKDNLK